MGLLTVGEAHVSSLKPQDPSLKSQVSRQKVQVVRHWRSIAAQDAPFPLGLGRPAGPASACRKNGLQLERKVFLPSDVTIVTSSWRDGRWLGVSSGVVVG